MDTTVEKQYNVVNGTYYDARTNAEVIRIVEESRSSGRRLRIHLGDVETGRDWMDEWDVTGTIGRSTGSIKIPLLIHNSRSRGGGGILDHCIVKIRTAAGGLVLYQHPKYHMGKLTTSDDDTGPVLRGKVLRFAALIDGAVHARFSTEAERSAWITKMGIIA